MKVMWFSVTPPASGMQAIGRKNSIVGGGWIDSLIQSIPFEDDDIEIWDCFLVWGINNVMRADSPVNPKLHYIGIPSATPFLDTASKEMRENYQMLIEEINPDIVHVFGTETENSNCIVKLAYDTKCLISLTGLVYIYERHFFGGVEKELKKTMTVRDLLRGSIFYQYRKMKKKAEIELDTLSNAQYVTGRTSWDYASSTQINPNLQYYFCNENLRNAFYTVMWSLDTCERHTVFSSSSGAPLKGVHQLLKALPIVLKKYPDTVLYVTGDDPRKTTSLKNNIRKTGYQNYLIRLMNELDINKAVRFTGVLDEQEMAERCASSHVYVLPSFIENSPNSLCEAMLMGVPSVAADVGGVADLLTTDVDGLLYPVNEYNMLAYQIMRIFQDDVFAVSLSDRARQRALIRHDREKNGKRMKEIYMEMLREK